MSSSLAESAEQSRVAMENEDKITMIRGKIRRVDREVRVWEERIERVQEAGEKGEEDSKGVLDEFERAIRQADRQIAMKQRIVEQMWRELSDMRGYM